MKISRNGTSCDKTQYYRSCYMIKKFISERKTALAAGALLLFSALYVFLRLVKPSEILRSLFNYTINNPDRVNNLFYKQALALIALSAAVLFILWFIKTAYYLKLIALVSAAFEKLLKLFSIHTLLAAALIYLAVLFPLAVSHYDLGYDEAVYLEYAKYFAKTAVVYINLNEKIILVDTIAMLPYYIASVPLFWLNLTALWYFKAVSVLLSLISLFFLFRISRKLYGFAAAVLFLFFLGVQPGFGFIASSYFGELIQAAFLLYGFYFAFSDSGDTASNRKLITSSLLISLAVHTKFQLAFIITFTLLALYVQSRRIGVLKLLGYTILFSGLISFVRTIPVLIFDYTLLRRMILITDIFAGPAYASWLVILDKFQLFNRFFPLPLFIIISAAFYYYCRNLFERALFFFSVVTVLWWIFLYPLTTYRNPFMGIITICLMAAVLAVRVYNDLKMRSPGYMKAAKVFSVSAVILLMAYGFSANIIYAYIGYNDGVQFDLDGFKNRLFTQPVYDTSQKDFYRGLNNFITPADTVYNGTWVAQYYLDNPVCTFDKMKESLSTNPGEKYMIVTRDFYPLGFEKIYSQIDSLGVKKELMFKTDKHELFRISK